MLLTIGFSQQYDAEHALQCEPVINHPTNSLSLDSPVLSMLNVMQEVYQCVRLCGQDYMLDQISEM